MFALVPKHPLKVEVDSSSDMEISSTRDSSPVSTIDSFDLQYIQPENLPSPKANSIYLDNNGEIAETGIFPPSPFSADHLAQIKIDVATQTKIDQVGNEEVRNHLEVEARERIFEAAQEAAFEAYSHIEAAYQTALYTHKRNEATKASTLREAIKSLGHDTPTTEAPSSSSSGWSQDDDIPKCWPSPPTTPAEGDNQHPPQLSVCGQHPGQNEGWIINQPGTRDYYRLLIADPATNANVVAPYVKYTGSIAHPEIWGTYGKNYRTHVWNLMPTRVGYISGPLSIDHGQLLNSEASYVPAVNKVIDAHFPRDLAAGVRQYQHYNETRYSIQKTIRELQAKEMRYLERAVKVLSELECANVIGRLLAHLDTLSEVLVQDVQAHLQFSNRISSFQGHIPTNARDLTKPLMCTNLEIHTRTLSQPLSDRIRDHYRNKAPPIEPACDPRIQYARSSPVNVHNRHTRAPVVNRRRCHKCHQVGHIRAYCPNRYPAGRK